MCLYPKTIPVKRIGSDRYEPVTVSCGKCVECLSQKSNEWAHRIIDECKQHEQNCFITLTYNEHSKPSDGSLRRRDLQLFLKRLRKHVEPLKIRIFYCGEYGKKGRPHYHVIIFGWKPSDLFFWQKDKSGAILYRSPQLEKLWTYHPDWCKCKRCRWSYGFSSVGDVTVYSAKYCAKYMQKLLNLPDGLVKSFIGMSNRPGIGYAAIDPVSLTSDRIYHSGKSIKVPRYYLKVLEREGHDLTEFKALRQYVGLMRERGLTRDILQKKREKAYKFAKRR